MKLPGNFFHQKILQILVDLYKNDHNVEALGVFGSVAMGNWDNYSDLDLDAVVKDDSKSAAGKLVEQMISAFKTGDENVLLNFEEGKGEWVIIFDSLDRLSIKFHLLSDTKPQIKESLVILYGKLDREKVISSVTEKLNTPNLEFLVNKFLEISIYVPIALHRKNLVNAQFFLNKMRQTLIEIYTVSHGIPRSFDFEAHANKDLVEEISQTYALLNENSVSKAHRKLLELFSQKLIIISGGRISTTPEQKIILEKVVNY